MVSAMIVWTGLMPPVTKDGYRRKLALAKELGFNYVRPHSQVLTPEYVAKLPPDAQKQFIGEVLYERITPDQPALAGKVCRGAWTRVTIGRL